MLPGTEMVVFNKYKLGFIQIFTISKQQFAIFIGKIASLTMHENTVYLT